MNATAYEFKTERTHRVVSRPVDTTASQDPVTIEERNRSQTIVISRIIDELHRLFAHSTVNRDLWSFIRTEQIQFVLADFSTLPGCPSEDFVTADLQEGRTVLLNRKHIFVDSYFGQGKKLPGSWIKERAVFLYPIVAAELFMLRQIHELKALGICWPGGNIEMKYGAYARKALTLLEAELNHTDISAEGFPPHNDQCVHWYVRGIGYLQKRVRGVHKELEITSFKADFLIEAFQLKLLSLPKHLKAQRMILEHQIEVISSPQKLKGLQNFFRNMITNLEQSWHDHVQPYALKEAAQEWALAKCFLKQETPFIWVIEHAEQALTFLEALDRNHHDKKTLLHEILHCFKCVSLSPDSKAGKKALAKRVVYRVSKALGQEPSDWKKDDYNLLFRSCMAKINNRAPITSAIHALQALELSIKAGRSKRSTFIDIKYKLPHIHFE